MAVLFVSMGIEDYSIRPWEMLERIEAQPGREILISFDVCERVYHATINMRGSCHTNTTVER